MADKVASLNIEIGASVGELEKALKKVDGSLKNTQSQLKQVEKALKLDPGNTELLARKQELLAQAAQQSSEKFTLLSQKMENFGDSLPDEELSNLKTDLVTTGVSAEDYSRQAEEAAQASESLGDGASSAGDMAEGAGQQFTQAGEGASMAGRDIADAGDDAEGTAGQMEDAGDAAETAGNQAADSGEGWTIVKSIIADLAKDAIDKAISGLKTLGSTIKDSVKDSSAFADEVLTLSTVTGISTDAIQEMKYSAELLDTDFETIQGSLKKLTNNMRSARDGNEATADAFARLGISVEDGNNNLRNSQDVFYEIIDALSGMEAGTERDALAMQLFGKSAQDLNPLIAAGSEGIKAFADEAHNAGAVLDGEALGALGAVDDGFQRLDQATLVAQRNLALAFAPAISTVSEVLAEMAADADWQSMFSEFSETIIQLLPDLTTLARALLPAAMSVLQKIVPVVSNLLSSADFGPVLQAAKENIDVLIPILLQLAEDLLPELVDFVGALIPVLTLVLQILQPFLNVIGPMLGVVLQALAMALQIVANVINSFVIPAIEKITGVTDKLGQHFRGLGNDLGAMRIAIRDNWEQARAAVDAAVSNMASKVGQKFKEMGATVGQRFQEIKEKITKPIEDARAAVERVVSTMKSKFEGLTFSLPRIKMPHLSVSGSWSFNPPRVPHFSVRWYRDAMANGIILNTPTIFGQMNGRFLGAGEAGPEAVVGVTSLRDMIRDAVAGSTTNNNYGGVNVVVYGAPGQDVNELADIIEDRINTNIARRAAAF